jgi:FOG: ankyrin repeat-like protein
MKHLLFLALLCGGTAQSQIKNFYPKKVVKPDLSAKREKEINRQNELLQKKIPTASEQKELNMLLEKYGEVVENAWDIIDGGCSWYCGGGNYKIKASSSLGDSYKVEFANDLSYKTAWVEGKKDEGIGEYLEYYFKNDSPRITEIIISNGYMKSEETWKNNNRVKKLKLYVNGVPFGILNLKDSQTNQYFEMGTLGHNKNGTDLILKFEILEVYKGSKHNDTAITEIYFDGIDVH